jgi:hypothetical protein
LAKEPEVGADKFVLPLGVSMFFSFLKMIIILLILRFLIFDTFMMIASAQSNYCETTSKTTTCRITRSGYRLRDPNTQNLLIGVDVLNFVFIIFAMVYFVLFRRLLEKLRQYTRGDEFVERNYTVMVENIPLFFYDEGTPMDKVTYNYRKMIQEAFEGHIKQWQESIMKKVSKEDSHDLTRLEQEYLDDVINNKDLTE